VTTDQHSLHFPPFSASPLGYPFFLLLLLREEIYNNRCKHQDRKEMLNKEAKEAYDLDQEELAKQEERKSKATGGSWGCD